MTHLIKKSLDIIDHILGAQHFDVVGLETDALVVQGLVMVLVALVPPQLVEVLLRFSPLFVLVIS